MECLICFEQYNDVLERYECSMCTKCMCLGCFASLKKEECPFCRASLCASSTETEAVRSTDDGHWSEESSLQQTLPTFSQSYPPLYTPMWSPTETFDEQTGEWRQSRILTRQLRRERKRMDHEQQQLRNAELSRLHNRQLRQQPRKAKRGKTQTQMMFDMEIDASV